MPRPTPATYDRLRKLVPVTDSGAAPLEVFESFTGAKIADVPAASAADVTRMIAAGREAAESWQRTPMSIRAGVLIRFADLVLARRAELMDIIQAETGKARISALEEITDVAPGCGQTRCTGQVGPQLARRSQVKSAKRSTSSIRPDTINWSPSATTESAVA
ncbi:aldehyde dehydrogenase family protein [Nocardia fluminea]|uniref:aldehyde dehydrogenase family protein n=1 Tax=Nocardia fluminea TaxID=134984 RepID=UPI00381447F0